jgi:hypothetical protein
MNKLQTENDTTSDGLINFEKKRRVAALMDFIRKYQKEGYRFIKVEIIWYDWILKRSLLLFVFFLIFF